MTPFQAAIAAAQDTVQALAGVTVVYRRGAQALELRAAPGQTPFRVDTAEATNVLVRAHDWTIRADALAALYPPREHDLIEHTVAGELRTYQLLPFGDEPCWRFSDTAGRVLRLHTKLVDQRPPTSYDGDSDDGEDE